MLPWQFCDYLGHNCPDLRLIMLFFFLWVSLHVTLKRGRSYTVDVLILERRAKSLQYYRWQENKLPFSGIFCLLLIPRSRFSSIMWLSTIAACFLSGLMLRLRWLISTVLPSFRLCGFFCWFLKRQRVVCLCSLHLTWWFQMWGEGERLFGARDLCSPGWQAACPASVWLLLPGSRTAQLGRKSPVQFWGTELWFMTANT